MEQLNIKEQALEAYKAQLAKRREAEVKRVEELNLVAVEQAMHLFGSFLALFGHKLTEDSPFPVKIVRSESEDPDLAEVLYLEMEIEGLTFRNVHPTYGAPAVAVVAPDGTALAFSNLAELGTTLATYKAFQPGWTPPADDEDGFDD